MKGENTHLIKHLKYVAIEIVKKNEKYIYLYYFVKI